MSQAYQDKQASPGTGVFREEVMPLGILISHVKAVEAVGEGWRGPPCRRLQGLWPRRHRGQGARCGRQEEDEECG